MADISFETGRLHEVVAARPNGTKREYRLLVLVVAASCVPYAVLFYYEPWAAVWLMSVLAFLQVLVTFATSAQTTGTSHHMRFLLAGRNPIAMTGGASLLLGAVDAIIDWREDQAARKRHPIQSIVQVFYKFMATPLGLVVMLAESLWDLALLNRGLRLVSCKHREFFALSRYHDLVCPEKSNDIFYADLAFARYLDDQHLYQWNRLRAMVFELQHYYHDVQEGVGIPETNLLLQDDVTAYQTLKRLECERIEQAVAAHYRMYPDRFLLPPRLTAILVRNARPVEHYLRFRKLMLVEKGLTASTDWEQELQALVGSPDARPAILPWHILRIVDEPDAAVSTAASNYLGENTINALIERDILEPVAGEEDRFELTVSFRAGFEAWLNKHFRPATPDETAQLSISRLPTWLHFQGEPYVRR